MSIVALKRKVDATFRAASTGAPRFSLAGGHRSQGYVGQGVAARHFSLSNNGQLSTERPALPKPTVGNYPAPGANCQRSHPCRASVFKAPLFASQEDYLRGLADLTTTCAPPPLPQADSRRDCCIRSCPPVFMHRPHVVSAATLRQASYDDYVRKTRALCGPQDARKVLATQTRGIPCPSS